MRAITWIIPAALLVSALPAMAAQPHHHSAPKTSVGCKEGAATVEYRAGMDKMHREMDIEYSGQVDRDFTAGMIPHHQGAVDMAKVELKYGKDPQMRELARLIIIAQEQEIGFMKQWMHRRGRVTERRDSPTTAQLQKAMEDMHHGMMVPYTGNADIDFARGMIPHHQGAIDMAWVILKSGSDPEIIQLSRNIVRSQQNEIGQMQRWLERQGKTRNDHASH